MNLIKPVLTLILELKSVLLVLVATILTVGVALLINKFASNEFLLVGCIVLCVVSALTVIWVDNKFLAQR